LEWLIFPGGAPASFASIDKPNPLGVNEFSEGKNFLTLS
jgi:hypothetical protein